MITENTIQGRKYVKELTKELMPVIIDFVVEIVFYTYKGIGTEILSSSSVHFNNEESPFLNYYYQSKFEEYKPKLYSKYITTVQKFIKKYLISAFKHTGNTNSIVVDGTEKTIDLKVIYTDSIYKLSTPVVGKLFINLEYNLKSLLKNGKTRGTFGITHKNAEKADEGEYVVSIALGEYLYDLILFTFEHPNSDYSVAYNLIYGSTYDTQYDDLQLKKYCEDLVKDSIVRNIGETIYHELYHYYQQSQQYGVFDTKMLKNKPRLTRSQFDEYIGIYGKGYAEYVNMSAELYAHTLSFYDKHLEDFEFDELLAELKHESFYNASTPKNKKKIKSVIYSIAKDEGLV